MKTAALGNSLVKLHVFLEWTSIAVLGEQEGFYLFFPFDVVTGKSYDVTWLEM